MDKYNPLLTLHDMALKPLGGQPKGDYWSALQKSTRVAPINIENVLELTPGQLFEAQKDIRRPLARVRAINATWKRRGRPIARYGNVNPR